MGQSCSNCNCNKDERDELKIDEKHVSSHDRQTKGHYDGLDISDVAAVFGHQQINYNNS
jgi:hypothetical protein